MDRRGATTCPIEGRGTKQMNEWIELLPEWLRDEAKDIEPDEWFDISGVMAMVGFKPSHDSRIAVMPDQTGLGFQTSAYIQGQALGTIRA